MIKLKNKSNRVAVVWYFRSDYWWTNPRDVKAGHAKGFGWDCWDCHESKPGLPSLDAAKREAEGHSAARHGGHVAVKYEDGTYS